MLKFNVEEIKDIAILNKLQSWHLPEAVQKLLTLFATNGLELFIVGGAVRDQLLERSIYDYDFATSASPKTMIEILDDAQISYHTIGIKHGTLGIIIPPYQFEVTTYRSETTYSDGRHPDSIEFTRNLSEDLLRRDFTINSFAYNPEIGLFGVTNSLQDLKTGIIRTVGNPRTRFNEDKLRIMRALRLAMKLNFLIEPATRAAMQSEIRSLATLPQERLAKEWAGIWQGMWQGIVTTEIENAAVCLNHDIFNRLIYMYFPQLDLDADTYCRFHQAIQSIGMNCKPALDNLESKLGSELTGILLYHYFASKDVTVLETILPNFQFPHQLQKLSRLLLSLYLPQTLVELRRFCCSLNACNYQDLPSRLDLISDWFFICQNLSSNLSAYYKFKDLIKEAESRNLPYNLRQLKINGQQLLAVCPELKGAAIKNKLEDLWLACWQNKVENANLALINYLKDHH